MARKSKDLEAAKARLSHVVEQTVAEQRRLKAEGFSMAIDRLKRLSILDDSEREWTPESIAAKLSELKEELFA